MHLRYFTPINTIGPVLCCALSSWCSLLTTGFHMCYKFPAGLNEYSLGLHLGHKLFLLMSAFVFDPLECPEEEFNFLFYFFSLNS